MVILSRFAQKLYDHNHLKDKRHDRFAEHPIIIRGIGALV